MPYTDDPEFLQTLSEEPLTTAEVAEELGLSDRQARKRLNKLVEEGLVEREGKGFATWSLTNEGREEADT